MKYKIGDYVKFYWVRRDMFFVLEVIKYHRESTYKKYLVKIVYENKECYECYNGGYPIGKIMDWGLTGESKNGFHTWDEYYLGNNKDIDLKDAIMIDNL